MTSVNSIYRKSFRNLLSVGLVVLIVLISLLFSSKFFFRIDLTSEKRYTLSSESKQILRNLDDIVYIRLYLDGDLNIPLTQFRKSLSELLDEFKAYGSGNIDYEVIDPFEGLNDEARIKMIGSLQQKGLNAINIHHKGKDGSITEKIVIPGAIVIYQGIEIPLNLLLNNPGKSGDENLNNSIESLEYVFISTIKDLTAKTVTKIAFLEGHGEWPDAYVGDLMKELSKSYQIDRGKIDGRPGILDPYRAIIIAGPVAAFTEKDKFILDQYIMQGGRVLWLLDAVNVNFDSLATGYTFALPNDLNIDDMLFRYGIRINKNIIQDAQCSLIPINMAVAGSNPDFRPVPWMYYPLISPAETHPVTSNMNMVWCRFASSIDTIKARTLIQKTPLLVTSPNIVLRESPAMISLSEISSPPKETDLLNQPQTIGILLEGVFESVFKNRGIESYFENPPQQRLDESGFTKMIVVADADIIRNDVRQTPRGPAISPLGLDRYSNQTYGNKDFLVNAVNYLCDDSNLIQLRNRQFKIRLLNRTAIASDITKWQIINIFAPLILVILAGFVFAYIRKKRYTK